MSDDADDLKQQLDKLKPKKKKLAVPEGFLDEAKSYEGKLMAIRIIAEREKDKVLLMFKGMIAKADEDRAKLAVIQEKAKRDAQEKEALERAALIAKNKAKKK
jgi:cobalamin biosynthesis Co2+ chelatase CbiK